MNTINSTVAAVGVGVDLAPAVKRYFESTFLMEMKVAGPSCNADFVKTSRRRYWSLWLGHQLLMSLTRSE